MNRVRLAVTILVVLLLSAVVPPVASANCTGVICGGVCNLDGYDFCIYVWGGDETMACRNIQGGCFSMGSLVCCPRDPRS